LERQPIRRVYKIVNRVHRLLDDWLVCVRGYHNPYFFIRVQTAFGEIV
jgi:hypothetical protein